MITVLAAFTSCKESAKQGNAVVGKEQSNLIFPQGRKITNDNFSGTAWLHMLVKDDSTYNTQIGNVTFEPRARTRWHYHKGGQILLVINGKGLYQEKGKPLKSIQQGDVIRCLPNVVHWHGATPTDTMVHVAVGPNTDKGGVVWLEKVSDTQYNNNPL